jgi:RNA polymerase sigma factor (sigma-70 family)
MTDEEIISEINAGGDRQTAALKALYLGKGKEFHRYFMWTWKLGRDEADDVLQEAVLKILNYADSYKVGGTAGAWMWQIARNTVTDNYRKKPKEAPTEELDEEGQRAAENQTSSVWGESGSRSAEECFSKGLILFKEVEPERAYVIELLVEGVDGQEIANRISRSYTATRQYLTQCRKALAPYIEHCRPLLST